MSIESFIEKFAFAIEVDTDKLAPETQYKDLSQWDSLNALSIIAMVDADYGITLSGQAINDSRTIEDLWKLVSANSQS